MNPAYQTMATLAAEEARGYRRPVSRAQAQNLWNKDGLGKPAAPEDARGSSS